MKIIVTIKFKPEFLEELRQETEELGGIDAVKEMLAANILGANERPEEFQSISIHVMAPEFEAPPLDKNGRKIAEGDAVVPLQTEDDYHYPKLLPVHTGRDGELWVEGKRLSDYRNGDTNYHAVEIRDVPAAKEGGAA